MNFRLIDDWQNAHKLGSVQISSVLAVIFGAGPALFDAWGSLPPDLKDCLPHGWARWIATFGFVLVVIARLVKADSGPQGGTHDAR